MTDLDDIPDLMVPTTEPTVNVSTKRCGRHDWYGFDREQVNNATGQIVKATGHAICTRCGKVRDEAAVRRNRNNRARGGAFERTVAKQYGGRKTGPLGGRDDVMVGQVFAIQTKRALRLSLNEARTYLDDLARIYPDRTPVVIHALPGERGGVVIWRLNDHVAQHGKDGMSREDVA